MNLYNFFLKLLVSVIFLLITIIKDASAQMVFDNRGNVHLTETLRGNLDPQTIPHRHTGKTEWFTCGLDGKGEQRAIWQITCRLKQKEKTGYGRACFLVLSC